MSPCIRTGRRPQPAYAAALLLANALSIQTARGAALGGNVTLTSDYIWRGSTQTLDKPAAQANFKISSSNGFYASAWGSNVNSGPATGANLEIDAVLGWAGAFDKHWSIDASAVRYNYLHTHAGIDWNEVNVSAKWCDRAWLGVAVSSNAMATQHFGTYGYAGMRIPDGRHLRFEFEIGHYTLRDGSGDYNHASASAIWTLEKPVELRLTAHAIDAAARRRFGNDNTGTRLEAALQATF